MATKHGSAMKQVVGGKLYNTETAEFLGGNAYADHANCYQHGNLIELFRTKKGAFFAAHYTQWQGQHDYIEPLSEQSALRLYEVLGDDPERAVELFPNCGIVEA